MLRRPRKPVRLGARRGVSLIEALIALAICALLLTATMVATDASYKAYANATEQASTQATTRMVVYRLLTAIRTGQEHGPLQADNTVTPAVTISGSEITSPYIEFVDPVQGIVRVQFMPDTGQLMMITHQGEANERADTLLAGVTGAEFRLQRRKNEEGIYVLARATIDLAVEADDDSTLSIERRDTKLPEVRLVASTTPRSLD